MVNTNRNLSSWSQTQTSRDSGRVGSSGRRAELSGPILGKSYFRELIALYQKLLSLRDQDESELSKAIFYGIKIRSKKTSEVAKTEMNFVKLHLRLPLLESKHS